MNLRSVAPAALAVGIVLAVTGCSGGGSSTSSTAPTRGGNLVMDRAADVTSLLPTVPTDNASIWTLENVYDTLVVPTASGGVGPSLATSWKQSTDKLSWTFNLRKGVKFSNGSALTSADVKFSIEKASAKASPFAAIDSVIVNIATPNATTVVLTTKTPWAPLPADMALYANSIVPKDYGGMTQAQFAVNPIGSGPFKLRQWVKGQRLVLARNPYYWKSKKPYLDSVTFSTVSDANTRATQVASGQAQVNEFPSYSSIAALKAQRTTKVGLFPSSRVDYLSLNTTQKVFQDPLVRKAIAESVDRAALIKAVLFGHGTAAHGYMSPALWAYDASIRPPAYDIAAAKATLKSSTEPNGFTTTFMIASGDPSQAATAQILQASLAKIGITVKIQTLDSSTELQAQINGNFDMTLSYQTTDIIDPDEMIRYVGLNSGGSNAMYTFYKNSLLDSLAKTASTMADEGSRKNVYSQMQQIVNEASPFVTLYYSPAVYAYSPSVRGFRPLPTGNYNLADVWLAK